MRSKDRRVSKVLSRRSAGATALLPLGKPAKARAVSPEEHARSTQSPSGGLEEKKLGPNLAGLERCPELSVFIRLHNDEDALVHFWH